MPKSKKKPQPTFEEALSNLEDMVDTMESGELPLEELIKNYEEGAELLLLCEGMLDEARKKLETINLKPTSPSTTKDAPTSSATLSNNEDDEIRLF